MAWIDGERREQSITWSSIVSCAIGDTSATFSNASILTTSIIEPYSQNSSGTPMGYSTITVTVGQVVLAFDALEEATDFRIKITNL